MLHILFAIQILLLEKYLVGNLEFFGVIHVGIQWLILFTVISILCDMIIIIKRREVALRWSVLFFAMFMIYFMFRCAVDIPDLNWGSKFIGSDAGILFYFMFGYCASIPWSYVAGNKGGSNEIFDKYFIFVFFVASIFNSVNLLNLAFARSREDLYLVESGDDLYQWPGDLLSIRILMLTILTAYFISINKHGKRFGARIMSIAVVALFTLQCLISIFFSQIIGSNKAVVIIVGCWLCLIALIFAMKSIRDHLNTADAGVQIGVVLLIRIVLIKIVLLIFGVFGLLFFSITLIDFPFDKFRIFGFGSGQIDSVSSRLELLMDGFIMQFSVDPFWGHAGADYLTLGEGRYIHSTIANTLTHTGLVGFVMHFAGIFILLFEQKFQIFSRTQSFDCLVENNWELRFVGLLLFLMILLLGAVSSSFVWGVYWFSFGLYLSGSCSRNSCLCVRL